MREKRPRSKCWIKVAFNSSNCVELHSPRVFTPFRPSHHLPLPIPSSIAILRPRPSSAQVTQKIEQDWAVLRCRHRRHAKSREPCGPCHPDAHWHNNNWRVITQIRLRSDPKYIYIHKYPDIGCDCSRHVGYSFAKWLTVWYVWKRQLNHIDAYLSSSSKKFGSTTVLPQSGDDVIWSLGDCIQAEWRIFTQQCR